MAWLVFAALLICLLASLLPQTDFDHDGWPDSLLTEGLILLPVMYYLVKFTVSSAQLPMPAICAPRVVGGRLNRPPILY